MICGPLHMVVWVNCKDWTDQGGEEVSRIQEHDKPTHNDYCEIKGFSSPRFVNYSDVRIWLVLIDAFPPSIISMQVMFVIFIFLFSYCLALEMLLS